MYVTLSDVDARSRHVATGIWVIYLRFVNRTPRNLCKSLDVASLVEFSNSAGWNPLCGERCLAHLKCKNYPACFIGGIFVRGTTVRGDHLKISSKFRVGGREQMPVNGRSMKPSPSFIMAISDWCYVK